MKETLMHYVADQLHAQGDEVDLGFDDDLVMSGLDSIGFLRLIDFIEQEFETKVPPGEVTIENFGTISNIANYLRGLSIS